MSNKYTAAYADTIPPGFLLFINTHILDPSSPFQAFVRHVTVFVSAAIARVTPLIGPAIDYLTHLIGENPNIVSAVIIIVLAYITLEILAFVRRVMLFWTRLALRLVFWGWIALLISFVWQRGVEKTVTDVSQWAGYTYGMVSKAVEIWVREYQVAREQQERASQGGSSWGNQKTGHGNTGAGGGGWF